LKILIANLGSTSLKWRLFDCSNTSERLLHKGGLERVSDYPQAIEACLEQLKSAGHLRSQSDLAAVGFKAIMARGVNGCVQVNESVIQAMEAFSGVAPAHNPPYITGMRLFAKQMPGVPLVALFETAFCQWAPPTATRYAVPEAWHELGVRRWGFHGASHKFIAERSAELLGRADVARRAQQLYVDGGASPVSKPDLRVISCHLGGSSSVTGILNGVAIGNSMGLSPQSGLPQNNRVGDLDAFALPFVMRSAGLTLEQAERLLCNESGLKALSGGLTDARDLESQAAQGNPRAQLALDVLVHHARHWIGSYLVQLNGADALVFTAGMGENQTGIRQAVCEHLDQLGLVLDPELNQATRAKEAVISAPGSRVKVLVIPTNEEVVVAREVKRFLEKTGRAAPSSGAASQEQKRAAKESSAGGCKAVAAPGDGRTPPTNLSNLKR
jgi:acetate kinase